MTEPDDTALAANGGQIGAGAAFAGRYKAIGAYRSLPREPSDQPL
jgi:hypothetical protein